MGEDFADAAEFEAPLRLECRGEAIRVESPGYAAPCWADIDNDGKKDLLVGQFHQGKMRFFKSLDEGKFGEGKWLEAEGEVASTTSKGDSISAARFWRPPSFRPARKTPAPAFRSRRAVSDPIPPFAPRIT